MYRILIVDDEDAIREGFAEYAQFLGHDVTQAKDGMEAVRLCRAQDFDIILMDIMMPRMDGYTACKEIRKEKDIPVLMLSARSEEYDKLYGFDVGIDDYVTKPFSPREVLARVQVIITRHKGAQAAGPADTAREVYTFGGTVIDMSARTVTVDGARAELTPKEYDLLFFLVRNRGIALSREKILSEVWGYDFYGDDSTVNTHIKMLRAHIAPYEPYITTIRGVGYRFETEQPM
ncbi:MAG: response regulator transcription factor [Oscillospiraceae bacterium]|jgi:DNA-binding response OmpR family regulator|nr:response regulator transcription factor [Oscillospiraceae bacterium]